MALTLPPIRVVLVNKTLVFQQRELATVDAALLRVDPTYARSAAARVV